MTEVVSRRRHVFNNKFYGLWVEFGSGDKLYVAYRKGSGHKGYFYKTNSWCLDDMTLDHARFLGVRWIAVIHDVNKSTRHYYLTLLEDFFGENSGAHTQGTIKQRYLPRAFWRESPYNDARQVSRQVLIRR
jgi:hypothetical protein